jgi:SAM-dependent methyltransferase
MTQATEAAACPVCGRQNPPDALFCAACIAPLRVPALAELDDDERRQSLDDLVAVLAEVRALPDAGLAADERELLHAYLSAFWLRPETALVQFAEARLLAPLLAEAPQPFLDLGCGDGIHTSLLHGWRFEPDFDAYRDLDLAARDIFAAPPRPEPANVVRAGRTIDLGVDIKPAAVERARLLGTFARVEIADALALPLGDGEVGTVYSNVLRDFDETLDDALAECARVLARDGLLLLPSPTEHYQDTLWYVTRARTRTATEAELAERDLRLDRGRSVFCRQQVPVDDWRERLEAAGFALEQAVPYAPPELMRFWDTGARPFSPALAAWAAELRGSAAFPLVKAGSVAALERLLEPLAAPAAGEPTGFRLLVARRR